MKKTIVNEKGTTVEFVVDESLRGVYVGATTIATESTFLWTRKEAETLYEMLDEVLHEDEFRAWYHRYSKWLGLNPDPDHPDHHYDWRAAWRANAVPDENHHWPSKYKLPTHPNRYVNGVDTINEC